MAWRLLLLLLTACVVRLWLMPLPSSFWTDETATAFVVRLPGDASLDAAPQVPASIYYALPRAAERLLGNSEISYRIPSVLLMGIALLIIGQLAARLIAPGAAWFAVAFCFALTDLNYYAADARPYPLGICVAAACLLFLVNWLDSARWVYALLFLIFAALLWRVHLVFWTFYPIFPIYTLVRLRRGSTQVGWLRAVLIYAALAAALVPVGIEALGLLKTAQAHVITTIPGPGRLAMFLEWRPVAYCLAIGLAAGLVLKWPRNRTMTFESAVLIALWWLWMPVCLWTYSVLSGTSLFLARYLSPALPGVALAASAMTALWLPRERWTAAAAVIAAMALVTGGHWGRMWPHHSRDNWKDGARTERALAGGSDTPVIAVSPFVEAQPPVWKPDYVLPGFLYAPLFSYRLEGAVYPFPMFVSDEGQQYGAKLLRETIVPRRRFVVFGSGRFPMDWVFWFAGRPELDGWSYQVHRDDGIETVVFEKPG